MATKPCDTCVHYDPILRGGVKPGRQGWCAATSVYPHLPNPGQEFPVGVKRAAAGELAQPTIVTGAACVAHCMIHRSKS